MAKPGDWVAEVLARGAVFNLGQLSAGEKRQLDKAAKAGQIAKVRGYWPWVHTGSGPLRAVWVRLETTA